MQNVAGTLEDRLSSAELTAHVSSEENQLGLALQPTLALYRGLQRCRAFHYFECDLGAMLAMHMTAFL